MGGTPNTSKPPVKERAGGSVNGVTGPFFVYMRRLRLTYFTARFFTYLSAHSIISASVWSTDSRAV